MNRGGGGQLPTHFLKWVGGPPLDVIYTTKEAAAVVFSAMLGS